MSTGGTVRVVLAAMAGNTAIAVTKYVAAAMTGSSAMFAEAIHSTVDTGNQILLLLGIKRAARPADETHPFGYGKEIYFWSFVVAILLFAIGAGVSIYEGILKILEPHPIEDAFVNYIVLGLAMVFEAGSWWVAWRHFSVVRGKTPVMRAIHESKDPAMFTVLFEDSAALLGLLIAFAGVFAAAELGILWADGLATLMIGLILAAAAVVLAVETKGLLIGEAAAPAMVADLRALADGEDFVERVNELRTMHLGPQDVLVALSVDVRDTLTAAEIEDKVARLERTIRERHAAARRVFIEVQGSAGGSGAEPSPAAAPAPAVA